MASRREHERKQRIAVIETFVDLGCLGRKAFDRPAAAVAAGIYKDAHRETKIKNAVEHAVEKDCNIVLLPGWSLVGNVPPSWMMEASIGRTIVAECLLPLVDENAVNFLKSKRLSPREAQNEHPWRTFVVHDGEVVIGPTTQRIVTSFDVWSKDENSRRYVFSDAAIALSTILAQNEGGRRFKLPGIGAAVLWVCGEVNLVEGGAKKRKPYGCKLYDESLQAGLKAKHVSDVPLVLNPGHIPGGQGPFLHKRAWLSMGGLLVNTTNGYSRGWRQRKRKDGTTWFVDGRGRQAGLSSAYWHGYPVNMPEIQHGNLTVDGYAVRILDSSQISTRRWIRKTKKQKGPVGTR